MFELVVQLGWICESGRVSDGHNAMRGLFHSKRGAALSARIQLPMCVFLLVFHRKSPAM